jgi:hypothetical protein
MIFVLGMPNQGITSVEIEKFSRGSLNAILVLVGVLPQGVRNRPSLAKVGFDLSTIFLSVCLSNV